MNIKEYISSGIIESYVLGLASADERAEFEQLCTQYPELVDARNKFELSVEEKAMESKMEPPAYLKERVWSAIQNTAASTTPKIITMESSPTRSSSALRWVAAAAIILFLFAGFFAYTFYNQKADLQAKLDANDSIVNKMMQQEKEMTEEQKIVHDPNATVVNMVGMTGSPSSANVYWDSTSTDVYLVVKNMPRLPSDKQYQLWALIGNKQADLGLFDPPQPNVILKMKNTQKADAFAITIENRGNTDGPTLKQLQSLGKAKL